MSEGITTSVKNNLKNAGGPGTIKPLAGPQIDSSALKTKLAMTKPFLLGLIFALAVFGCGKTGERNSTEATLDELNRALSVMSMGQGRPPTDVNDLTNFPSLRGKVLPKPPPGKKLVFDAARRSVVFADQ
jgi:hypothetical protein